MNELERENKRMALVSVFHVIREKYCLSIVLLSKNDFSNKKIKVLGTQKSISSHKPTSIKVTYKCGGVT